MSKYRYILSSLLVMAMAVCLTSCGSDDDDEPTYTENDYCDAVVDGIGYHIESLENMTVTVAAITSPSNYSGSITIPSSVNINGKPFKVIAVDGFADSKVTSVTIPNSVEKISNFAFLRCKTIKSINLPSSVKEIGVAAFFESGLESITIPATVNLLYLGCFSCCDNLKTVTIADSNEPLKIYTQSYANAYDAPFLSSLVETLYCGRDIINSRKNDGVYLGINGGITVGDDWQYTLKYLTLGESVTDMSAIVSLDVTNLSTITCKGVNPPAYKNYNTPNECFMKTVVKVPASALDTYKTNEYWKQFWNIESIK